MCVAILPPQTEGKAQSVLLHSKNKEPVLPSPGAWPAFCPCWGTAEQSCSAGTGCSALRGLSKVWMCTVPPGISQGKAEIPVLRMLSRAGPCCVLQKGTGEVLWGSLPVLLTPTLKIHRRSGVSRAGAACAPCPPPALAVRHSHVHPSGVQGAVPVHRQELHPANLLLLLGLLEVCLQHAEGDVPEVIHCKTEQLLWRSTRPWGQPTLNTIKGHYGEIPPGSLICCCCSPKSLNL